MYYHVKISVNNKHDKSNREKEHCEIDKADLDEIERRFIEPFEDGEKIQCDGYFIKPEDISRISVKRTKESAKSIAENLTMKYIAQGVFTTVHPESVIENSDYSEDITSEVFEKVRKSGHKQSNPPNVKPSKIDIDDRKIFIVHGRDEAEKLAVARFISQIGLDPIILHEQPNNGRTIIEKIEDHSDVRFAVVLYTPCDTGGLLGDVQKPRARQNVVFEHRYLIAKLGRGNVLALVKGELEIPNDINGVVYEDLDPKGAWKIALARELISSGLQIDMGKVIHA